jgi:hypothetical protein
VKFKNATSFKNRIKKIAQEKNIPAQQVQQNYLIEEVLKLLSKSSYKNSFVIKGGFLIGQLLGIDKRTTMDLDTTLKGKELSEHSLLEIFSEILEGQDGLVTFTYKVDSVVAIRAEDQYGGFTLKLVATYETLKEVVYIDITTGDSLTPSEISYRFPSLFNDEELSIQAYNIETVLAEKIETVISRAEASTRPRDRYDIYNLYQLRQNELDLAILKKAIQNTFAARESTEILLNWRVSIKKLKESDYQKEMWRRYQKGFRYARGLAFEEPIETIETILTQLFHD